MTHPTPPTPPVTLTIAGFTGTREVLYLGPAVREDGSAMKHHPIYGRGYGYGTVGYSLVQDILTGRVSVVRTDRLMVVAA